MNRLMMTMVAGSALAAAGAAVAAETTTPTAAAKMIGTDGQSVGQVLLQETPNGVLLTADITGIPAGSHGFHIHETGKCEPPEFKSAGGHYNPGKKQHGFLDAKGIHAGDLPNVHVPDSGRLQIEFLVDGVTLVDGKTNSLLDADGSAVVVHAGADDYKSDPAGNSGARIACGVVKR